ncbi:hypothetical protein CK556_03225 [Mesoplasma chauliocola]|uniref:Uncharacterized protein n=1 Tax=Mesoplasma chauliocola TaxID=216427 RepID=A0A249SPD9_9MOLU|nr:hypothetical protein [Mesoplasma chauliocola]ASZ09341.1 hypothetical protein CK556_03225 [Mesoplasma chauliocola]
MSSCYLCKGSIKPYQLTRTGHISTGAVNYPNQSNIGFVATGGRTITSHMGCYKTFNKKYWPWVLIGIIFVIIAFTLFIIGFLDFFNSKTYNYWDSQTHQSIYTIDYVLRSKAIIELVFSGIFMVLGLSLFLIGYYYCKKIVQDEQHANDYIDEEIKLIYDVQLKQAKKGLKENGKKFE